MAQNQIGKFECTSPCANCPYRKDAPLAHWAQEEFEKVLNAETEMMGAVFMCHKQNGSACIGFVMNQDERDFPSIALRVDLIKNKVNREYLDSLSCKSEMFESVEEMCEANFPGLTSGREIVK